MSQKERIQFKAFLCVLGILLLLILVLGQRRLATKPSQEKPEPEPPVPVKETLTNVLITEVGEDNLILFRDGLDEYYDYGAVLVETESENGKQSELRLYQPEPSVCDQVADVYLTDGLVTDIVVKSKKIHGSILSASADCVEVEGYGVLPLAEDYRGYRIFHTLEMCTYKDLVFGYDFADLVMDDGKVCAILLAREETMENIRVLLKTADFGGIMHEELILTADSDFVIRYGGFDEPAEALYSAGEEVVIDRESAFFEGNRIYVIPKVLTGKIKLKNVSRAQESPGYRGHLELVLTEKGIAVVNELSLEEYLYSVVPSEMPASYSMEALKAQAICARTYAYNHMQHAAYPAYGAHVDDSTSYQVYNNIAEQKSTTTAVKETYGELLYTAEGTLAETYYYSTSCGVGSDANVWKTEAAKEITYLQAKAVNPSAAQESQDMVLGEYLREEEHFAEFIRKTDSTDFEANEGWYRWSYRVKKLDASHVCEVLKKRYLANPKLVLTLKKGEYVSEEIKDFTKIKEMYIASRGAGGVADVLLLETDSGTYQVISEHNIRYVLCDGESKVERQNGSKIATPTILPSGFFIMETGKENGAVVKYTLTGGGFGHGVGMSQNAARHMAESGYSGEDILLFFYKDCRIETIYSREQ